MQSPEVPFGSDTGASDLTSPSQNNDFTKDSELANQAAINDTTAITTAEQESRSMASSQTSARIASHAQNLKGDTNNSDHTNDQDLYGIKGILSLVHMSNVNINVLALGTDLTTLGLNLNLPEPLFASFASPLLDEQPPKEAIEFFLPPCYYMNPPSLKMAHLQKFTAETLFYIFYTIVSDALQGCTAVELYNRGWVYHSIWRKWFTTNSVQQQASIATAKTHNYEEMLTASSLEDGWIYFEPSIWSKCTFNGHIDNTQFLKIDSLRNFVEDHHFSQQQSLEGDNSSNHVVGLIQSESTMTSHNNNNAPNSSDRDIITESVSSPQQQQLSNYSVGTSGNNSRIISITRAP